MFSEASATAFSGPVAASQSGRLSSKMGIKDLAAAISFRRIQVMQGGNATMGKSRRREWQARPFQKEWLKFIEAALPDEPILAAPAHELYTQPIATFREKAALFDEMQKEHAMMETTLGSPNSRPGSRMNMMASMGSSHSLTTTRSRKVR